MRDPFAWSFPVGRVFGITIRIHILFPLVAAGLIMREAADKDGKPGVWIDATVVAGMFLLSVLLHEFGHCFTARSVGGDASEVLLWPLGGLATVDVPHSPRANSLTAAGGPLVNLFLSSVASLVLIFAFDPGWRPAVNPFSWYPYTGLSGDNKVTAVAGKLFMWHSDGSPDFVDRFSPVALVAQFFWVNWVLFLFNIILVGFPFDSGRMLQSALWPYFGYRQATVYAVFSGFFVMFVVLFVALFTNQVLLIFLAFYIYTSCTQQWMMLEHGGDDSLFGYDFSQGYTSLEKEAPAQPRTRQPNFFQRWRQRRAARKLLREQQRQEEEELRMDQLLEKIQQYGKDSLTDEEHRFLKKVADRFRNRP